MRWLRKMIWNLKTRRCRCGKMKLAPNTTMEIGGVKHQTDGPCYLCDSYGNPLSMTTVLEEERRKLK